MYLSYNWLKELVDFDLNPGELDHVLTMLGIEVEEIIDYKKKYDNFYVGKVLSKEKHSNADKLSVCEVDFGHGINTVVCGASNVEAGQKVIIGLPDAIVPLGGFRLESRAVRKIVSDGMICSEAELEIGNDKSGIKVLPNDAKIGQTLYDYLNLNDIIFDISLTPNKADCNSHIGIARELSAYNNNLVKIPKFQIQESDTNISDKIKVIIKDEKKCPRYTARVIRNVKIKESPDWLKNRLLLLGLRPRNIVVDVTNYVLMECGQPLHSFDLGKIADNTIICKTAEEGEKFITLDSKERILDNSMLMICDAEKNIAIGGVMGGENSEINDNTTDVLLESAFFNPSSIRRTSKKLGIQSDASYRFERGVDIENLIFALNRASSLIAELTGGIIDKGIIDVYPNPVKKLELKLRYKKANDILGININPDKIVDMLKRLRFEPIEITDEFVKVKVPYSRVDVSLEIDLVEEIARLYNYDNIKPDYSVSVSLSESKVVDKLALPELRANISDYLIKRGFNEIITQNIIDPESAKIFDEDYIKIANPLGEELSVMRPSIIPSILKTLERNIRNGNNDLKIFEIGKSFHYDSNLRNTFVKGYLEKEELIIAIAGNRAPQNWNKKNDKNDFYDIKGITEDFIKFFRFKGIKFKVSKLNNSIFSKNSMLILNKKEFIGSLGEVDSEILQKFNIENKVYLVTVDLSKLYEIETEKPYYSPVSPFPKVTRDLGFVLDNDISAQSVKSEIESKGGKLLKSTTIFDVFEGKSLGNNKKSIAFSLSFSSMEKTLKDEEVNSIVDKIITAVEKKFNAQLRKF